MCNNDRGAVTAEFMLLMPALISVVAIGIAGLQIGLASISLELDAALLARAHSYGFSVSAPAGTELFTWREAHLSCLRLSQVTLVEIASEYCLIQAGS